MTFLRGVNLNLLPILRELLRKANVTHAARELNMSQPAVSEALNRLRLILHDELLIPSGRTFILSALAQRLQPQLESALAEVETLLAPAAFDPASGVGKMRIATSDYIALLLAPQLALRFNEQAPSMSIEVVDTHLDSNFDLRMGEIDMIIAPAGQIVGESEQFSRMQLFEDELVYLVAAEDGVARLAPGEDLSGRPHIFCDPRGRPGFMSFAETVLRQRRTVITEAARVSSYMLIPFMIGGSDNVALVQRRLAERLLPVMANTVTIPPSEVLPKLRVMASWSRSREHDPAHSWFRGVLSEIPLELGLC